jgi:hypothetical protein
MAAEELGKRFDNISVIVREKKGGIGTAIREGYNNANKSIILSSDNECEIIWSNNEYLIVKL